MQKKYSKVVALIVSFLFPIVGIILFIRWLKEENVEKKKLGRQCLVVAFVIPILFVLLGVINFYSVPSNNTMSLIVLLDGLGFVS